MSESPVLSIEMLKEAKVKMESNKPTQRNIVLTEWEWAFMYDEILSLVRVLNRSQEREAKLDKAVELLQADNKDLASWHIAKDELIKEIER